MTELDLNFIRDQFPAFSHDDLQGHIFMENAGGSYMCRQVMDRLTDYYHTCKVQPYYPNTVSTKAGNMMDEAYGSLAKWMNVSPTDVYFGPSTSQNTYVLSHAVMGWLQAGDQIIVTNQDHEANGGVWRRLEKQGIEVIEWAVNPETGSLEIDTLKKLFTEKTKLLTFPHCSNIVAEINDVSAICQFAHDHDVRTVVDGVSYAGHGLPDVAALGADVYLFSLYKVYGPHQGVMVINAEMADKLAPQSHFFLNDVRVKRLMPSGPDHAQIAAIKGVSDYFDAVYNHHFPEMTNSSDQEKSNAVHSLFQKAEQEAAAPLIAFVQAHPKMRLIGPADLSKRAPTLSFIIEGHDVAEIATKLGEQKIACGAGHYYSYRLLKAMGIDPEQGVLRLSLVHYNSAEEMERVVECLDEILRD